MLISFLSMLFGTDPLAKSFSEVLTHRRKAISESRNKKRLQADLYNSEVKLADHKLNYTFAKNNLEAAYRLDLD